MTRCVSLCVLLVAVVPVTAFTSTPFSTRREAACRLLSAAFVTEPETQPANLYHLLGATGVETRQELKQLYRSSAKRCHPDAIVAAETFDCSDEFIRVSQAYRILSDPKQRLHYDRTLAAERFTLQACERIEQVADAAARNLFKALDWINKGNLSLANAVRTKEQRSRRRRNQTSKSKSRQQDLFPKWMKQMEQRASSLASKAQEHCARTIESAAFPFQQTLDWQRIVHTQLAMTATVALTLGVHALSLKEAAATGASA
jgi:hypothetical protein